MLFRRSRDPEPAPAGRAEAPWSMLIPMYVLLAAGLALGFAGDTTLSVAGGAARELLAGLRGIAP